MANKVSICNMALSRLGATRISSLEAGIDSSSNAATCSVFYEDAVNELIALHDWSWATARRQLSALSSDNYTNYLYKYQLNTDVVAVLKLIDSDGNDLEDEYEIEKDCLYTNVTPCLIKYMTNDIEEADLSPVFVELLVLKIASKIAYLITSDQKLEVKFLQLYEGYLRRVKGQDTFHKKNRPKGEFTWGD